MITDQTNLTVQYLCESLNVTLFHYSTDEDSAACCYVHVLCAVICKDITCSHKYQGVVFFTVF